MYSLFFPELYCKSSENHCNLKKLHIDFALPQHSQTTLTKAKMADNTGHGSDSIKFGTYRLSHKHRTTRANIETGFLRDYHAVDGHSYGKRETPLNYP